MADNTGDPDADAVLSLSQAPASPSHATSLTGDADADAVLGHPATNSDQSEVPDTWWNAIKGVGEAALAVGSATLKTANEKVNDLLPGDRSKAELAAEIEKDPVLNYRPGPEAKPIMDTLNTAGSAVREDLDLIHNIVAGGTNERTAEVVGDLGTLGTLYRSLGSGNGTAATSSKALEEGQKLGYVVPPATTNPTLANKFTEGFAGKLTTAQEASIKNQAVTNDLMRKEFGLPQDAELLPETMQDIRAREGKAYQAVRNVPDIQFGPSYNKALDALTGTAQKINNTFPNYKGTGAQQVQDLVNSLKYQGTMDGGTAIELSKSLRSDANGYQAMADRTGDPSARALAQAHRGAAEAVENAVENHLIIRGQGKLADDWDNARRTIAKTYSVENAMDGAGNVDALKLGKQLLKGKPLSDNLEAAANFANAFPKAARNIKESMPGVSPLDYYAGAATEAATGSPAGLLIGPARMGVRSALLGPVGQYLARPGNATLPADILRAAVRSTPALNNLVPPVPAENRNE